MGRSNRRNIKRGRSRNRNRKKRGGVQSSYGFQALQEGADPKKYEAKSVFKEDEPGLFSRIKERLTPTNRNVSSGRRSFSPRSWVGDVSPEDRPQSIYDESQNTVQFTNQAQYNASPEEKEQDEKRLRAQMQDYYGQKMNESMKKAKEIHAEEVKEAKKEEKAEKKRKSNCNSQLRRGCMFNCNKPTGNQIDCNNCVNKYFDEIPTGKTKCKENEISHYLDTHVGKLREDRIIGKAKEEQAPRQRDTGYEMGTYGDNLPQENEDRKEALFNNPTFGLSGQHSFDQSYDIADKLQRRRKDPRVYTVGGVPLGYGPDPRKHGLFSGMEEPRRLPPPYTGGARRRRRTKRRKPKKSKKSKRTRRTRRTRRQRR